MNHQFFRAHKPLIVVLLAITGALSTLGSQAQAASSMDFDDKPGAINISADSQNPTILNEVTVVCPQAGFLVATSTATAFMRNVVGNQQNGFVAFSISLERRRAIGNDAVVHERLGPNTFVNAPASVQRIDACTAGETRTYFHTVHGFAGPGNPVATEGRSKLVVQFFNRRI
jgi:hypothetical protein